MEKRLMRSQTNKVIGGVCGGLGEYFDVDPVFIRIITVILALATNAFGIVAYFVALIIMPKKEFSAETESATAEPGLAEQKTYSSWQRYLPGLVLIGIGAVLLLHDRLFWFDWDQFWPIMLVLAGLYLIFRKKNTNDNPAEVKTDFTASENKPQSENGGTTI